MQSKLQFYHFQKEILEKFESEFDRGDKKIHIVAPPGSGKTIIGIEIINRLIRKDIYGNILIFVPNITIQYQWKEKIEKFFLEESEEISDFISTDRNTIKKINIITYQSISSATNEIDDFLEQILKNWFDDIKEEFKTYEDFLNYVENLKETDVKEYGETINDYKKKLKLTNTKELLSDQVKSYLEELKKEGIATIVVDEAHHLTSWWSKVLYYSWEFFEKPFIIGLTATPPFDNSDFFVLNDDYTALLGEVDYYVPTPAIVKAGRLAPYSDLVYFVEPNHDIKDMMKKNDIILNEFLENNKNEIGEIVYKYVQENYDKLLKNSQNLLENYLRFLYNYTKLDISEFAFSESVFEATNIEDIAKSTGKYIIVRTIESNNKNFDSETVKSMFYNLGYIWRGNNFYKFRTPVEMALVYAKSKMNGIKIVLENEYKNKGNILKCAIITDFLEEGENNYINCKFILDEINKSNPSFNSILVSGQGIWEYKNNNLFQIETNILEITKKLESGEINLIIGTRGILGEGWDCPKLNVLIDLTGVSAFMSVNQIRGRAIRLDQDNLKKVANIYDIVCLGEGYKGKIDFERVARKYENFYGVDASGIVIKGIDHIYPDLEHHLDNYQKINENMIKRSSLLEYFYSLWGIGGNYENKEVFGLNLKINDFIRFFPFVKLRFFEYLKFNRFFKNTKKEKIEDIGKNNFYFEIITRFIKNLLDSIVQTLIKFGDLPEGFTYEIKESQDGNFKIVSNYKDALVSKTFINHIKNIFSPVSAQRYMIDIFSLRQEGKELLADRLLLPLPNIVAKNTEYREKIESNLSEYFLKNIYGKTMLAYQKSTLVVNGLFKKVKLFFSNTFFNKILIIVFFIFMYTSFLSFVMQYTITKYLLFGLIIYISAIILTIVWMFLLFVYLNIFKIFKIILLLVIFIYLIYTLNVYSNIKDDDLIFAGLFYMFLIFILFIIIRKFINKITKNIHCIFFKSINKKEINKNSKITKSGINSDYIRFIYLNSPEIDKKDYIGKEPFINSKIEKLWI